MKFPGSTVIPCPFHECEWHLDVPGPEVKMSGDASDLATSNKVLVKVVLPQDIEKVLREHLLSHSLLEWLAETNYLRFEIEALKDKIKSQAEVIEALE